MVMWNYRGLGKPLTVHNIKGINKSHSPEVLFLSETKNNISTVEGVLRRIGFQSCFAVNPTGMAGGLVVTWKEGVNVQILNHDTFFIHFIMESQQESRKWEVIGVYLHTDEAGRDEQYTKLLQIMAHGGDQVLLTEDFNAIRAHHEKEGGRAKSADSIQNFNDFINAGGLVDMGFEGKKFTWNNRQFGGNFIQKKLDRALVSVAWRSEFSDAFVKHLDDLGSDHKALLLCSHKEERRSKRRF
ncbi:uncharacterized protein [Arachis hypogaea]|uniref:uncharacterized protein n=1 Tax=Arachis hypogaea TaxID=3818 RepID=UPI003B21266E